MRFSCQNVFLENLINIKCKSLLHVYAFFYMIVKFIRLYKWVLYFTTVGNLIDNFAEKINEFCIRLEQLQMQHFHNKKGKKGRKNSAIILQRRTLRPNVDQQTKLQSPVAMASSCFTYQIELKQKQSTNRFHCFIWNNLMSFMVHIETKLLFIE